VVVSADSNTITRNVISGNQGTDQGQGVSLDGAKGNTVSGNLIGVDVNGNATAASANGGEGVSLNSNVFGGCSMNTIGGTNAGDGNVISNNLSGVVISSLPSTAASTGNVIQGNFIGTDPTGKKPAPNRAEGILISGSPNNTIGGTAPGAKNV